MFILSLCMSEGWKPSQFIQALGERALLQRLNNSDKTVFHLIFQDLSIINKKK